MNHSSINPVSLPLPGSSQSADSEPQLDTMTITSNIVWFDPFPFHLRKNPWLEISVIRSNSYLLIQNTCEIQYAKHISQTQYCHDNTFYVVIMCRTHLGF